MHDRNAMQTHLPAHLSRRRSRACETKVHREMHTLLLSWTSVSETVLSGLSSMLDERPEIIALPPQPSNGVFQGPEKRVLSDATR